MYESDHIASESDSRLLFNLTDHLLNNSIDHQDTFFDIMNDLLNRCSGFDSDVTVSRNRKQAQAICLNGKYALFQNIPHPHMYVVSDHVCHTTKDTVKHTMAHGMGVNWTQHVFPFTFAMHPVCS